MIKIKLLEDDGLRAELETLHWLWFSNRMKTKCSWNKNITYRQFLKNNIKYAKTAEMRGLTKEQIDNLFESRLKELVVGPDNVNDKGRNFFSRWIELNGPMKRFPKPPNGTLTSRQMNYNKKIEHIEKALGYSDFCTIDVNRKWYKNFFEQSKRDWGADILFNKLNINVCPYCNREYIFNVILNDGKVKKLAEIDHFLPQGVYPYFSCYLYNFVPSCLLCNHGKKSKIRGIIYPYNQEFGDAGKFNIKLNKNADFDFPLNIHDIQIRLKLKGSKEIRHQILKSNKMFCILPIYNDHKIEIRDLLKRYNLYGMNKCKSLYKYFDFEKKISSEQIPKYFRDLLLGLPLESEEKQYPLRKFKEDIIEQLDAAMKR